LSQHGEVRRSRHGFNKRKMEDQCRTAADKEAASRRATDAQVLEDAERLIAAWNEPQAKCTPMLDVIVSPLPLSYHSSHSPAMVKAGAPSRALKYQGCSPLGVSCHS
jgi:hypothetical protein